MAQVFNHEALLRARLELGMTQDEAAAAAGVDVRTYRRYESGEVNEGGFSVKQSARRRMLQRLSAELGLDEAELVIERAEPLQVAGASAAKAKDAAEGATFEPLWAHSLQRARHFVGREELLDGLAIWVKEKRAAPGIHSIVGVGGSGKTAVAERVASRLGEERRAGGVFVWSFYEDERTESFLAKAAAYFTGTEGSPGDRLDRLCEALRSGAPHFLVLDGLETVQSDGRGSRAFGEIEDPLLRRLLVSIARGLGAARALVTSRFELTDLGPFVPLGARMISIAPLRDEDAKKLLLSWGAKGDDEALERLSRASEGHPLSLAVTGSFVGAFLGGEPLSFEPTDLAEAAKHDPLARRLSSILSAYARALSDAERDLLSRLSVLPTSAAEPELLALARGSARVAGAMAGMDQKALRICLGRLERLGIVFRAGDDPPRWSSHPFVRDYFRGLLAVSPATVRAAMKPQREHSQAGEGAGEGATLIFAPRQKVRDTAALDAMEALITDLAQEGLEEAALSVYSQSLGGFSHLGLVLGEMSRGARILRLFGAPDDLARGSSRLPALSVASLLYERGLYAGALGDFDFAVSCYAGHQELAERAEAVTYVVTGRRTLAYTERLLGKLASARANAETSVALAEACGLSGHFTRGLALIASIAHDQGDIEAARALFSRLGETGEAPIARRGFWEAEHLLALGRRRDVIAMTQQNVEVCERLGWAGHVAHGRVILGLALVSEDITLASRELALARPWVALSGEVEMAARVHELSARVALARGALFEAEREIALGERLAEACGLALFRARFFALGLEAQIASGKALTEDVKERARRARLIVSKEDVWGLADALHWAGLCLRDGRGSDVSLAASALSEALDLRTRLGHPGANETRKFV